MVSSLLKNTSVQKAAQVIGHKLIYLFFGHGI